ncbi:hypothetical protein [Pleomorphovibrio marinus]|uniref:hypothetical protein n=1 Tax=Pleomorphovibrio marinus TaxID=2164132 RepID=UPI000E0AEF8B|nr:hypothetical protein [Pleomorphovibrio marinus]
MERFLTLPLLLILLIASACQNDEDTLPSVPTAVVGTWETVGFNDYIELDYVTTYVFRADGTYTYSSTLREKDSDLDLGFNFLERGTFRPGSESDMLKLARTEFFHTPFYGEKLFYSEDELQRGDVRPDDEYPLHYEIRDNGNTFFIPGRFEGGAITPDMSFERRN